MRIKYKQADGKVIEIEVEENVGEVCIKIEHDEKKEVWKAKKRKNKSLEHLDSLGLQLSDDKVDIENDYIKTEESEALLTALKMLRPKQHELIEKHYFQGLSITEIAKFEGVSKSAVSQRLDVIHRKIKKLLEKT